MALVTKSENRLLRGSALMLLLVLICMPANLRAQDSTDAFTTRYDSLRLPNEIGIGISSFVKVIFDRDENSFGVVYKRNFNINLAARLGFNIKYSSKNDGKLFLGVAPGLEANMKVIGDRWRFYYGGDLSLQVNRFNSNKRTEYIVGVTPFVGVSFQIGKHFSINTEPGILFTYNAFDRGDFIDGTEHSFGIELSRLGTIRLNFHL